MSVIKEGNKLGNGKLKPEAKEKRLKEVEKHLSERGYISIREVMEGLGVNRKAAERYIHKVLKMWESEILVDNVNNTLENTLAKVKWHEQLLNKWAENPGKFDKDVIKGVEFAWSIADRIDALKKSLEIEANKIIDNRLQQLLEHLTLMFEDMDCSIKKSEDAKLSSKSIQSEPVKAMAKNGPEPKQKNEPAGIVAEAVGEPKQENKPLTYLEMAKLERKNRPPYKYKQGGCRVYKLDKKEDYDLFLEACHKDDPK